MAWSLLATMNQLGTFFQPGSTASGSPNAMSAAGCWLAARAAEAAQRSGSRLVCRAVPGAHQPQEGLTCTSKTTGTARSRPPSS
jgi:hypothetical protein